MEWHRIQCLMLHLLDLGRTSSLQWMIHANHYSLAGELPRWQRLSLFPACMIGFSCWGSITLLSRGFLPHKDHLPAMHQEQYAVWRGTPKTFREWTGYTCCPCWMLCGSDLQGAVAHHHWIDLLSRVTLQVTVRVKIIFWCSPHETTWAWPFSQCFVASGLWGLLPSTFLKG